MADSGYDPARALAALDALVAERDEARRDWQQYVHEIKDEQARAEAAEARADRMAEALRKIAQPMTETEGDWGSTYDWHETSAARRGIARAALAADGGGE